MKRFRSVLAHIEGREAPDSQAHHLQNYLQGLAQIAKSLVEVEDVEGARLMLGTMRKATTRLRRILPLR
ncbi:MAG: hypothetical protein V3W14_08950 [Candidatus Neomarinimicrobiota bacterium]